MTAPAVRDPAGPSRAGGLGSARQAAGLAFLVATPLLVAGPAATVVGLRAPDHVFYVRGPVWLSVLIAGAVLGAAVAVVLLVRWGVRRARARGGEEAARAALEDHRRFLLRLDHELKNPVTAMQAAVANLAAAQADWHQPGSGVAAALASVGNETRRLATLVADLRKLAELETRPIEQTPVDLAELLAEVCEAAEPPDRHLTLVLPQAPWPLSQVCGDRDLLFLAVYNLLGNAIKFTSPGGHIELRARDDGEQVVIEVADTGAGIPPDEIGQVWQELTRGRAARGTPGMGLGLALVRAVVTRHRGDVSVASREGHGTVVALRLPAAPPAVGRARVPHLASPVPTGGPP